MEFGPQHFQREFTSPECRKSPWRQLFYISNFFKPYGAMLNIEADGKEDTEYYDDFGNVSCH